MFGIVCAFSSFDEKRVSVRMSASARTLNVATFPWNKYEILLLFIQYA